MCLDPVSLAVISLGTTVVGTGMQVAGQLQQSAAQADQANLNAIAANKNADELEYQAHQRLKKMEFDVAAAKRAYERHKGRVVADGAKSGFDMRNFYDVLEDDARESAMEVEAIKYQAGQEERGLKYQADGERWDAANNRTAAGNYRTAGYLSAGQSLLSGFGQVAANPSTSVALGSTFGSRGPTLTGWGSTVAYG